MHKNISLTGMMGVGKSMVAEVLAPLLDGYTAVDTDALVEYDCNQSIPDIFAQKGEKFFRDAETKILGMVYSKENLVVALGGGTFQRPENREIIAKNSSVVYLKASPQTLYSHLQSSDVERPLLKKSFSVEDIEKILSEREENYMQADFVVNIDGKNVQQVVHEILGLING